MRLSGKIAIVTGAARGLGFACARRFLEEGANVAMADIDAAALIQAAAALGRPERILTVETDVTQRAAVDALVAATLARFGSLDIMLNNAGIARSQPFLDIAESDFDAVLGVNLKGAFFGAQAAGRHMAAQGRGVIINMSSINALLANPNLSTYAMSKGAMNQLTATAAMALAPHGVRVVGIGPGTILTEMVEQAIMTSPEARHAVLARTPLGRCGEPAEVAAVAAFLASDDASYITGQTIYPDGGRLVLNYTVPVAEA